MSLVDLAALVTAQVKSAILSTMLDLADTVGLDTETWKEGDPTRTTFDVVSRQWEAWEANAVRFIRGGFLELATGDALELLAYYHFGVDKQKATYAQCTVRLTNAGSAPYTFDPDDLTFVNAATKATYRNSTGGTLAGSGTLDLTVIAETAGSAGSSGVGTILALVTALPQVSVTNLTAAVGLDAESDAALQARCRAKLGALSPTGPADAYHYVATTAALNGGAQVTRTRVLADSAVGNVTVYVAGAAGAVSAGDVVLVQAGLNVWATPLTVEATAVNSSNLVVPVTYTLWVYDSISLTTAAIQTIVAAALLESFRTRPIGGDVEPPATTGKIYRSWIEGQIIQSVAPHGYRCSVSTPAGDTSMTIGQVATLGTVTPTVTLVAAP